MAFDQTRADRVMAFIEQLKHTTGEFYGKPFTLLPWQRDFITRLFGTVDDTDESKRQYRHGYLEIPKKNGKALSIDTPIPTPEGWTTMGDIREGDVVFGADGKPCIVSFATDIMLGHKCYDVHFSNGEVIKADADHLWQVHSWTCERTAVRSTEELTKKLKFGANANNYSIDVTEPLDVEDKQLPIPPYVLGVWLGDGSSASAMFVCSEEDAEEIRSHIEKCGISTVAHNEKNRTRTYGLSDGIKNSAKDCVQKRLRALGVLGNKHIPNSYLRASKQQRMDLLCGLMDSDGYCSKSGQCEYTTTSALLRDGIEELLSSLGYKHTTKTAAAVCNGKNCGEKYRIQFWAYSDAPCFKLKRKADRLKPNSGKTRSRRIFITDIVECESVPVRCIQVANKDHLYLAGRAMIPTHNTELGAAIALYMLVADGEMRGEVYSAACDRMQASICFNAAATMVRQSPALSKRIKIIDSTKTMVVPSTGSVYRVLSSDVKTKHGLNISAVLFDEIHQQPNRELYDVLTSGAGDARKQPLWVYMTTAGTNHNSIGYEIHQKAVDLLSGRKTDKRFLPVVYGLPEGEDWHKEENWYRANPSLGYTISIDAVRDGYAKALESASEELTFKILRLNQWVSSSVAWMQMDRWDKSAGDRTYAELAESLKGRECYCGLDLSSTSDLTAFMMVFPPSDPDGEYQVLTHCWIPKDNITLRTRRDHVNYTNWYGEGYIHATEGNIVDYREIRRYINELRDDYDIKEIAVDRWNATSLMQDLADDDFVVVPFGQGYSSMSSPTKDFERLAMTGKIVHGGHPVLRWCVSNVTIEQDPAGNIKMSKAKSTEKIDCAVALVMALDRAMRHTDNGSVYDNEDRSLLFL